MSELIGRFTKQEETANWLSHFAGAILASAGLTLMIVASALKGTAWHVVSTTIFGSTMVLLYFSSAVAHGLPAGRLKQVFFKLCFCFKNYRFSLGFGKNISNFIFLLR